MSNNFETRKKFTRATILPESSYTFTELSREDIKRACKHHQTIVGVVTEIHPETEELTVKLGNEIYGKLHFDEATIYNFKYKPNNPIPVQIYTLLSKIICVKVTSYSDNEIILSRKQNMIKAYNYLCNCKYARFFVTSLTTSIAFGDIGYGITGVLSIEHVTKARIRNICEYFHKNSTIDVMLLSSSDNNSFYLSYKDTFPKYNPNNFAHKDLYEGKVGEKLKDGSGYYIEISPNVCGLLDIDNTLPVLQYGQRIQCSVKGVSQNGLKLSFSKLLES